MASSSSSSSSSNFQSIFNASLQAYEDKTKNKLVDHPLAAQLQSCDSPNAVLAVLQDLAQQFDQSHTSDGRLKNWLDPTVNVLYTFSATLGGAVGLAFAPEIAIFTGIGVLLQSAMDVNASQDILIDLFEHIGAFFRCLEVYIEQTPSEAMTDMMVETMVKVLSVLATVTVGIKQKRRKKFLKKLVESRNDFEDALKRLAKLTEEEAKMAIFKSTCNVDDSVKMVVSDDDKEASAGLQQEKQEEVLQDLHSWLFQGTMFEESRSTPSDINAEARKKEENEARRREQEKRDREEQEKQRFDTDVLPLLQNAGQLKIYRHLFSFLTQKINSMKTLDPRLESLLPRLHTHFEKFVDYGIIVSISESRQFRETLLEASLIIGKDCYTTAFDIAGEEICALFQEVLLNSEYKSTIRSLCKEQAKGFMQELQEALKRGSPLLQEARLQRTARRIVIDLSKACGDVPNELYVKEAIKEVSFDPIYVGGFGRIHRGLCNGRLVALKRLFKLENVTLVQEFCKEAVVWKNICEHPHILTFLGVDIESFPGEMCMVSEWMSNGTIIEFLKREPHHRVEKYLLQIAEGIQHLHSQGMYHGDLKGANILVSSDRKAKIADFGFANFADMSVSYASVRMGTPKWMAPELLDTRLKFQRTTKSDIFAFACIAFEIYTGAPIFPDNDNVGACQRILASERPKRPTAGVPMPNRMWDFIEWCWLQDPSSRPQIEDVVKKMRELQEVDDGSISR